MPSLATLAALFVGVAAQSVLAQCPASHPHHFCALRSKLWKQWPDVYTNSCGYVAQNPDELIAERAVAVRTDGCPVLYSPYCCKGFASGNALCNLGTDCIVTGAPNPAHPAEPIPHGWTVDEACAIDDPGRVFTNNVVTRLEDNTPARCIAHCAEAGWLYAGVENGNECHCGNGYKNENGPDAYPDASHCSSPCLGNEGEKCGGGWAITTYTGTPKHETIPNDWSPRYYCAIDDAARVMTDALVITELSDNTPARCIEYCEAGGYAYAGVQHGKECHCSEGLRANILTAPQSECSAPCTGDKGKKCGGGWRIQIYKKW